MNSDHISRFWLDRAAGKLLGKAWQRKDRRIALDNPHDPELCDMATWLSFTRAEVRQIEQRLSSKCGLAASHGKKDVRSSRRA